MRVLVKRWGNGMAVRLPRESAELGRLEEGMELELRARVVKRVAPDWKPYTFKGGPIKDLSVHHDELLETED